MMDKPFIDYKLYSYMALMSLAMRAGDKPRAKKAALLAVVLARIQARDADDLFSKLVFVYNLDYKDPRGRGFIDFDVDAPLTHAVKEFWIDLMLHTEEGRKASREAFAAVFPEAVENALTVVTDPDGVKRVYDKDGVEVGTVEEE